MDLKRGVCQALLRVVTVSPGVGEGWRQVGSWELEGGWWCLWGIQAGHESGILLSWTIRGVLSYSVYLALAAGKAWRQLGQRGLYP